MTARTYDFDDETHPVYPEEQQATVPINTMEPSTSSRVLGKTFARGLVLLSGIVAKRTVY